MCHDPDACCAGQTSCPTPKVCGCEPFTPVTWSDPTCREARMVVLKRDETGRPTVWCDPEIADLVAALNAGGVPTVGSCSGHGEKPGWIGLADGRQLLICATAEELKRRAQA